MGPGAGRRHSRLRLGLGVLAEREAPPLTLPVDGAAGCREDEGGARQPGGLEHVDGADDVHPRVERGLGDGPADVRLRREVEDRIRPEAHDQVSDGISIDDVGDPQLGTLIDGP